METCGPNSTWAYLRGAHAFAASCCRPQDNLAKKQAALLAAQEQLAVVLAKVQALKDK